MQQRGLTREQAASYLGLEVSTFDDWVAEGLIPGPIKKKIGDKMRKTNRWDRKAIDHALDELSGLEHNEPQTSYDRWKRNEGHIQPRQ